MQMQMRSVNVSLVKAGGKTMKSAKKLEECNTSWAKTSVKQAVAPNQETHT